MSDGFPESVFEDVAQCTEAAERRDAPRRPLSGPAQVRLLNKGVEGSPIAVAIQNMSTKGVGFRHGSKMNRGEEFVLLMPRPDRDPMELLCAVARCELGATGFVIGASFTRVMSRR